MKRSLVFLLSILFAFSLAAETAVLQDVKGKVEVKALGGAWTPAKNGMKLDLLATVSTGFDSSVVLAIAENRVAVAPLTRLTIDKILAAAGSLKTNLNLRVGSISAQVKSSAGVSQEFKVTSPYSTASVRGTTFTYDGLALAVREGRVAFIAGRPVRDILLPTPSPAASSQGGEGSQSGATSGSEGQSGGGVAGSVNSANIMAALQGEFQGDTFSAVDQPGQAGPGAAPSGSGPNGQAGSAPAPAPQTVFVGSGYTAVIAIDFSAPEGPGRGKPAPITGGSAALPPPNGGPGGGAGQGGGFIMPPMIHPSSGQNGGSIRVQWN